MGKPNTYNPPVDLAFMFLAPATPQKNAAVPPKPPKPLSPAGVIRDPINAVALANTKPIAAPDPVGFAAKMNHFKADANGAQKSLTDRYTDSYYDSYHGDAVDYAAQFKDTEGKLTAKANSLLGDIESLRGVYGDKWADDAARTVNNAVAKFSGYADRVKNDAGYWTQFEDVADYGAAMFDSGAETGDEFRQMVEAKNAKSAIANQAPYQMLKGQNTTPLLNTAAAEPMSPVAYAIAMNAKNSVSQGQQATAVKSSDEQRRNAEAILAKKLQDPQGYAIAMQAKNQKTINEAKENKAPASYAPGMDSIKFGSIMNQYQTEINQLEKSLPTLPLDEYNKVSAQISKLEKQQANLVTENADIYIQQNIDRLKILAQKETLTPTEKHEAMMGAAALREAAGAYHFGSAYDPVEAGISNGYNALAGILENKFNGIKGLGISALASIPNAESGYGSYLNNEAFQVLTRQNMYDPEIAGIVNQYNPFEDLKQNRPGVYYAGLVGGNLIQGAAGKAAGKALGLTAESAALPFDADELFKAKINNPLESIITKAYNEGAGETVVIGESMKRVIPYAEKIGAEVYEGFKYYDKAKAMFGEKIANFIGGVDNALWLIDKMVQKYQIVDLGLDVERAIHSPYYLMESVLTYLYKHKEYVEDYIKGAF